ncbi:hypothetical protein [Caulobacter sp. 602-1]|uniref:hypothetical protein n=1 Tax=Caulobacter sp. 602-1 TaxID=2492472 RepID=UPI000F63636F|nr:hypothetical protein [Caulobacter sp. 602-1]RRN64663.1 hypothetical protein EIK80_11550 [Caulobacter sp. 602-1]
MSDNVIAFAPRQAAEAEDPIMAAYFRRWAGTKERLKALVVALSYEYGYQRDIWTDGYASFDDPFLEVATLAIDLAAEMAGPEQAARIAEIGAKRVRRLVVDGADAL